MKLEFILKDDEENNPNPNDRVRDNDNGYEDRSEEIITPPNDKK